MTFPVGDVLLDPPRRRGGLRRRLAMLARGPAMGDDARAWAGRATAVAAGVSAGVSAVIYVVLTIYQFRVPFLQLWVLGTAILLVPWTLRTLHGPPPTPDPGFDPNEADLEMRPFSQVERWRRRLETTSDDVEWFTRVVRARLVVLVGQRLRQRHGVKMAEDPARARAILGGPLYEFLNEPLPRTPTPHELEQLITRMEEI